MMKKIISVVLSLFMLLSCFSALTVVSAAAEDRTVPVNYKLVDQNANLALYLDANTGNFGVMNKKTGTVWYSNPLDWASDPIAKGDTLAELNAKIIVKYLASDYTTQTVTSDKASLISEKQGKDQILTFYFKGSATNFTIPIKLSLKDNYLHVELLIDKIRELGDSRVLYVKMFEMFGAAGTGDTGYGLLPDGSGSLMTFNQKVVNSYEFGAEGEGSFYATNPTETASQNYFTNWNEPLRLPVYGMVKNNEAYLNIIEGGAAVSEMRAYVSKYKNSYNSMYTCVNVRDTQTRRSSTGTSGQGSYYSNELPENYIARYYFLSGDQASYIGMAEKYRQYLIEEKGLTPVKEKISNALCISLFGGVKKATHFLGIPYTGVEELTSYDEAAQLMDRLNSDQVDKSYINYIGWSKGGLETTLNTDFVANSKLGGKTALKKLIKKANDSTNISLSFEADLQAFYGSTSRIKKFKNTAYGLDSAPVTIFKSRISVAGALDRNSISYQLIHPKYMLDYANEFLKNASSQEVKSFSFDTIGATLYCAYNLQDTFTRDQSANAMFEIYKAASEKIGDSGIVSTMGGNSYAMSYVDNVVYAPVYGSHNNIALQEVPFYQIVFRGYVNLASMPVNLNSEQSSLILKLAETGMSLFYTMMDADSTSFQDTSFTSNYACNLDDHYNEMITNYNRLKVIYDAVDNSTITNYQIVSDQVKITTFSNGAQVYVNYGEAAVTVNGVQIGARDFTVVGGANA